MELRYLLFVNLGKRLVRLNFYIYDLKFSISDEPLILASDVFVDITIYVSLRRINLRQVEHNPYLVGKMQLYT